MADIIKVTITETNAQPVTFNIKEGVGPGVPGGGSTGQVLSKASGASFDFAWVDNEGGGGGTWGSITGTLSAQTDLQAALDVKAADSDLTSHTGNTSNPHSVTAAQVGADPSGSAATVQSNLDTHEGSTANPHGVTASQVGLGSVDNTSDADKPISTATQAALDGKAPSSVVDDYLEAQVLPVDGSGAPGEYIYDEAAGVNATLTLSQDSFIGTFDPGSGNRSGTLVITQAAGGYTFDIAPHMVDMLGNLSEIANLAAGKRAVIAWHSDDGTTALAWITLEP